MWRPTASDSLSPDTSSTVLCVTYMCFQMSPFVVKMFPQYSHQCLDWFQDKVSCSLCLWQNISAIHCCKLILATPSIPPTYPSWFSKLPLSRSSRGRFTFVKVLIGLHLNFNLYFSLTAGIFTVHKIYLLGVFRSSIWNS